MWTDKFKPEFKFILDLYEEHYNKLDEKIKSYEKPCSLEEMSSEQALEYYQIQWDASDCMGWNILKKLLTDNYAYYFQKDKKRPETIKELKEMLKTSPQDFNRSFGWID